MTNTEIKTWNLINNALTENHFEDLYTNDVRIIEEPTAETYGTIEIDLEGHVDFEDEVFEAMNVIRDVLFDEYDDGVEIDHRFVIVRNF